MNIALIGPRGVGKSKISRKLSKLTGMSVISTDMIAVYELGGRSIADYIAETKGDWKSFRNLEFRILQKLSSSQNIILDCGGGILFDVDDDGKEIFSDRKYDLLKSFTTIVGLSRSKSYLIEKVQNDATRPSLSAVKSYEAVLENRLPVYKRCSEIYLQIDECSTKEVCKKLRKTLISLNK